MFAKSWIVMLSLLFTSSAFATDASVAITDFYAKPSAGKVGIAYFTATSTKNDAITGITSDCCDAVEIHRSEKFNGIVTMRKVSELELEKRTPRRVQEDTPTGEHVMLIGLKKPLVVGEMVKATFTFTKAPPLTIRFPVTAPKTDDTAGEAHHH